MTDAISSVPQLGVSGVTDPASLARLNDISDKTKRAEVVAGQLESVFFSMMVKAMRDTVPEGGLLGKGLGGQTYVEMLDQQLTQLGGLPRDPRFHEALVRQIAQSPEKSDAAMARLSESQAPVDQSDKWVHKASGGVI